MTNIFSLSSRAVPERAIQQKRLETVHCLMLPLHHQLAILPNAAVAEIVPFSKPEQVNDAPEWFLGRLVWREHTIPLISLETATGSDPGPLQKSCRIAVLNTLNGNPSLPYIGIMTQGLPSLQIVKPDSIKSEEDDVGRQSIRATVIVNGVEAIIPDLDEIETRIVALQ